MEKFRKHHCWPKPTIGRIRTVRECDFVGGVGPIPVYPVTSTKAVFNEKNENLEDILNNGIKFQDSAWIKNLYTTKIAPYIADGDTAEGKSYITFNPDGNLDISLKNKTTITVFEEDKELIYTKLTPDGIFIYNDEESSVITKITATESEFNSIKIHSLSDNDHNIWCTRIAGISDDGKIGEVALSEDFGFDNDDNLSINWKSIPLGTGLSFDEKGKLNCTVEGNGGTISCSCKITDVKYTSGIELFTFNGTTVYVPKIDVKPQYIGGTYIGSVDNVKFYVPNSEVSVTSEDLYSKEQIATVSDFPIYSYKYFDTIAPRSASLYEDGEWGKHGTPYKNNKILLNVESYYSNSEDNDHVCRPIIFTQSQWTKDNPDSTQNCPFAYIGPSLLEVRADCGEIIEGEAKLGASETYPDVFLKITPEGFYYNTKELCIPYQSSGTAIAQIAGKTIFAPNSSSSSISISSAVTGTGYKLASTNGTNIYKHDGITITDSNISANAFYQTSDERLKENIKDIEVPLEVLLRIPTVNFNFKDKDKLEMGTIAQEVEKICPEIINTDGYGYKSVDYSKLSILALKGLKDLTQRVNELEKLIDKIIGE